jgi:hypothetical protein
MTPARAGRIGLALLGLAGIAWAAGSVIQDEQPAPNPAAELSPEPAPLANEAAPAAPAPKTAAKAPPLPPPVTTDTPMADRVAVLGVLNKRNGFARDMTMRPGQAIRWGNLIVRLRACETTADWEPEQLTGAFVQADKLGPDGKWRRVFSGWLYKESPSLNVVEDPLYDVWPKSCTMRHPDIGPDTISAPSAPKRSIEKKSADTPAPAVVAEPSPSASSNSTT